jgi:hypothetical protein
MQKINDLQAQVQQLKQTQQQQQVLSAKEVDDTVDRVLRDADRRSQLLQDEGFTAGWDKGRFFLKSSDGNFLLRPTFQLQIRDGTTFRDHQQPGGGDDTQSGFEIRRAKFIFDGNASRQTSRICCSGIPSAATRSPMSPARRVTSAR